MQAKKVRKEAYMLVKETMSRYIASTDGHTNSANIIGHSLSISFTWGNLHSSFIMHSSLLIHSSFIFHSFIIIIKAQHRTCKPAATPWTIHLAWSLQMTIKQQQPPFHLMHVNNRSSSFISEKKHFRWYIISTDCLLHRRAGCQCDLHGSIAVTLRMLRSSVCMKAACVKTKTR